MDIDRDIIESLISEVFDSSNLIHQGRRQCTFSDLVDHLARGINQCQVIHKVMATHDSTLVKLEEEMESVKKARQGIENEKAVQIKKCQHRSWLLTRHAGVETIKCATCGMRRPS